MKIERIRLPGVGICFTTKTAHGERIAIIRHRNGQRHFVVYDSIEPQRAAYTVALDTYEAHQIADLLDSTATIDEEPIPASGLTVVRVAVPATSPYVGRPLATIPSPSHTDGSIVAVIRGGRVHAAPDPDFQLHADDIVVAIADQSHATALAETLAGEHA
jgi:TrkA domain protein